MTLNKFSLCVIFVLGFFSTAPAFGVMLGHERGGGHPIVFEFQRAFRRAAESLKKLSPEVLTREQWTMLEAKARDAHYVVLNEDVVVLHDGIHAKVLAANEVRTQTITIDARAWRALEEPTLAAAMAFHEIASLAGLEGAGRYALSAKYIEAHDSGEAACKVALTTSAHILPGHLSRLVPYADVIARLEKIGVLSLDEAKTGVFDRVIANGHSSRDHVYDWMIMERLTLPDGRQFIFDPRQPRTLRDQDPVSGFKPYSEDAYPAPYPQGGGIYI